MCVCNNVNVYYFLICNVLNVHKWQNDFYSEAIRNRRTASVDVDIFVMFHDVSGPKKQAGRRSIVD